MTREELLDQCDLAPVIVVRIPWRSRELPRLDRTRGPWAIHADDGLAQFDSTMVRLWAEYTLDPGQSVQCVSLFGTMAA